MKFVLSFSILFVCLIGNFLACSPPDSKSPAAWQYRLTESEAPPLADRSNWQPYQLGTVLKTQNTGAWFRRKLGPDSTKTFLYFPYLSVYGQVTVFLDQELVSRSPLKPQRSEQEYAEAIMNISMPHFIALGHPRGEYLYLFVEKIAEVPLQLKKAPRFISEQQYMKILITQNTDLVAIAVILIFVALVLMLLAFYYQGVRKRMLVLAALNITGAITLMAGNPYVWKIFSNPYQAIKWVMAVMDFIPVFIFWFFCIEARKHQRLLYVFFMIHLVLALVSIPIIWATGITGNTVSDMNMALFTVTQFVLLYVIITDYFRRDSRNKLIAYGYIAFLLLSLNDLLKSFGLILITERPLFHWGMLVVALIMLYIVFLEFENRSRTMNQSLQSLRELAYVTSHKLRLPIANIVGIVDLLKNDAVPTGDQKQWIEMLALSSSQLDAVSHQMNKLTQSKNLKQVVKENSSQKIKEIILVDDDPINNMINKRLLNLHAAHLDIKVFSTARQALEYIVSHPDLSSCLVLLDINMDEMNGFDLLDATRHLEQNLKVIMLSSSIDEEDIRRAYGYHSVHHYIVKPLRKTDIQWLGQT